MIFNCVHLKRLGLNECWTRTLKLSRLHIYRRHILFIFNLFLYTTVNECRASIFLYWLRRAVNNGKQVEYSKWKSMPHFESNNWPLAFRRETLTTGHLWQLRHFIKVLTILEQWTRVAMHVWNWFWFDVYWNLLNQH